MAREDYYLNPYGEKIPLTGEMRAPRSDKLYSAGQAMQKYLPGVGEGLKKVGAGMQLQPSDYVASSVDAAAFLPSTRAMTIPMKAASAAGRRFGTETANDMISRAKPLERLNAYDTRLKTYNQLYKDWFDYSTKIGNLRSPFWTPKGHSQAIADQRKRVDLIRGIRGYENKYNPVQQIATHRYDNTPLKLPPTFKQYMENEHPKRLQAELAQEAKERIYWGGAEQIKEARQDAVELAIKRAQGEYFTDPVDNSEAVLDFGKKALNDAARFNYRTDFYSNPLQ